MSVTASGRPQWMTASVGLTSIAVVSAVLAVATERLVGPQGAVGVALAGLGAVCLPRLPHRWWPSAVLLATIAAPAAALPVPGMKGENGNLSPSLLVLVAWVLLELLHRRPQWTPQRRWVVVAATPLVLMLALSTLTAPGVGLEPGSFAWSLNALAFLVLMPLLVDSDGARTLVRVFVVSGAVLGLYAVLEAYILRANPLWGWVGGGDGRAELGFGHPLYAASYFSVALVVAVHQLVRRPTPRAALYAAAIGIGLASAGSRGALIAAVVGLVGLASAIFIGRAGPRRQLRPMAVIGALFSCVAAAGLAQRYTAGDTEGSNVVRARSLETGLFVAERTPPFGGGPGRAYVIKTSTPGPGTDELRSIENAWVELYVAVGPMGCLAVVLYLGAVVGIGVAARQWLGVATVCSLLVAYTFYNALEGGRPLTMVLLGLALGWCLVPREELVRSGGVRPPPGSLLDM